MHDAQGFALWFTGLPGSGKSTVARLVFEALRDRGLDVAHLEMDARRKVYFPNPVYSAEERARAYEMLAEEAASIARRGQGVLIDATAPKKEMRDLGRERIPRFAEVHVTCSLETAMEREASREGGKVMAELYRKALERKRTGRQFEGLGLVPGVDVPFERDPAAECEVDSEALSATQGRDAVLAFLDDWLGRA